MVSPLLTVFLFRPQLHQKRRAPSKNREKRRISHLPRSSGSSELKQERPDVIVTERVMNHVVLHINLSASSLLGFGPGKGEGRRAALPLSQTVGECHGQASSAPRSPELAQIKANGVPPLPVGCARTQNGIEVSYKPSLPVACSTMRRVSGSMIRQDLVKHSEPVGGVGIEYAVGKRWPKKRTAGSVIFVVGQ